MGRRDLAPVREAVLDVHVVHPLRLQPGLLFQIWSCFRPQELSQDLRSDLSYPLMIRVGVGVLVDLLLRASQLHLVGNHADEQGDEEREE